MFSLALCLIGTTVSASFLQLIEEHYRLAEGDASASSISTLNVQKEKNQTFDLWFVLEQSNDYIKTDLVQLLDRPERAQNLQTYLQDWNHLLQQLTRHQSTLQSQYQSAQSSSQSCESQLKTANDNYREALKSFDEARYLRAIEQAKQARKCVWEQYVEQKTTRDILNHLEYYQETIQRRAAYLNENKNLIIQHYDILRPQLLARLEQVVSIITIRK